MTYVELIARIREHYAKQNRALPKRVHVVVPGDVFEELDAHGRTMLRVTPPPYYPGMTAEEARAALHEALNPPPCSTITIRLTGAEVTVIPYGGEAIIVGEQLP